MNQTKRASDLIESHQPTLPHPPSLAPALTGRGFFFLAIGSRLPIAARKSLDQRGFDGTRSLVAGDLGAEYMSSGTTTVAGFVIPSSDPVFLSIVAVHVLLGIAAAATGLVAMLSFKGPGRHPRFGTFYFWLLTSLFVSATALSVMRWEHAYHLFILGAFSFLTALIGREARRRRLRGWERLHIAGMGFSYVLMLIAFYVDNGNQLPPLNQLPHWTYWALPALVGTPIIVWTMVRHPLVRRRI